MNNVCETKKTFFIKVLLSYGPETGDLTIEKSFIGMMVNRQSWLIETL